MDYSLYPNLKDVIKVERIGDVIRLICPRFDSTTGKRLDDDIESYGIEMLKQDQAALEQQIGGLQYQLDGLNALIKDNL